MIPARGKIAGSYVNSALAKTDAVLAGFDEALMLNESGHLCEGSVENVFVVRGGTVVTPPVSEDILEGITRATVIHLLTGTGAQITRVTRVDHRAIGNGRPGPISTALHDVFFGVVRGRMAKYRSWCRPVYGAGVASALGAIGSA
jgi:branched-chain amino acid aminotransferase